MRARILDASRRRARCSRAIERSRWLMPAISAIALLLLVGLALGDPIMALIVTGGATWLFVALSTARLPVERWSPLRFFLPIFATYNALSIYSAHVDTAAYQVLLVTIAGISFSVGTQIRRRQLPEPDPANGGHRRVRVMLWPVLVGLVVSLSAFVVLAYRAGGIPLLAHDANAARVDFFPNGYSSTLVVVGLSVSLYASVLAISSGTSNIRASRVWWVILVLTVLLLAATANRGLLVEPIVLSTILVLWHRRLRVGLAVAMGFAGLIVFSILGYMRNLASFGPTYISDLAGQGFEGPRRFLGPLQLYVAGTSQTLDKTISFVPDRIPFQLGKQFFGPLLHQPSADLFLKNAFGMHFEGFGLALGAVNAFYLDWGPVGVAGGFGLFGWASAVLYRRARAGDRRWWVLYCYWLTNLVLSNYGHPFAYISRLLVPALLLCVIAAPGRETWLEWGFRRLGRQPRVERIP